MSKRLLKIAVMSVLFMLGTASVSEAQFKVQGEEPKLNDAVYQYAIFKALSQSTETQSQAASDPKEKATFKAQSELLERKAQELEQELLPLMREGMAAFERFLVTDFVLTLIAFQEKQDPSQAGLLKTFFLKSLGVSFEELEAEHAKLFSVFGEFLIYKQFRKRTDLLLEVGLLSERSDQKAFDKILTSHEDPEFREMLQKTWDQIQQEKQKREILFQISGKREIDFSRYAMGVVKKEGEEFDYYKTVNHLYPQTKRFFAKSLLNRLKELARPEVFSFLKKQTEKETIEDSALSLLIKTTIRALEKKEISLENVDQKIFKRADAWSHFTGGPESALVSSAILGLTAEAFVIGAIESGSILILGLVTGPYGLTFSPTRVLIAVGITTLFTAAQFGDEYIKDGEFSDELFVDRFGRNLLSMLPVMAGFRGLWAIKPLLAIGIGGPWMTYQAAAHYERGEYLQMGLSAALLFAIVSQGVIRIVRINASINPNARELSLEALKARVQSKKPLTSEELEARFRGDEPFPSKRLMDYWKQSTKPAPPGGRLSGETPSGGRPSPSHTPNTVDEIFRMNQNPQPNPILSQSNPTSPQGLIALMKPVSVQTQLGHVETPPKPILPQTLPQAGINISNGGGVAINPQALPVSPEHIQLILFTLYQNPDPQAENYRIGDLLTNKKDQKKSVVIVRKDPNTGQIIGITIALVSEEEFQQLQNHPHYEVYATGAPPGSLNTDEASGLIFPRASAGGGETSSVLTRLLIDAIIKKSDRKKIIQPIERQLIDRGEEAVPALLRLLEHASSRVRNTGIALLQAMGTKNPAFITALCRLLEHEKESTRSTAVDALARLGPDAKIAVDPLFQYLATLEDDPKKQSLADQVWRALVRIHPNGSVRDYFSYRDVGELTLSTYFDLILAAREAITKLKGLAFDDPEQQAHITTQFIRLGSAAISPLRQVLMEIHPLDPHHTTASESSGSADRVAAVAANALAEIDAAQKDFCVERLREIAKDLRSKELSYAQTERVALHLQKENIRMLADKAGIRLDRALTPTELGRMGSIMGDGKETDLEKVENLLNLLFDTPKQVRLDLSLADETQITIFADHIRDDTPSPQLITFVHGVLKSKNPEDRSRLRSILITMGRDGDTLPSALEILKKIAQSSPDARSFAIRTLQLILDIPVGVINDPIARKEQNLNIAKIKLAMIDIHRPLIDVVRQILPLRQKLTVPQKLLLISSYEAFRNANSATASHDLPYVERFKSDETLADHPMAIQRLFETIYAAEAKARDGSASEKEDADTEFINLLNDPNRRLHERITAAVALGETVDPASVEMAREALKNILAHPKAHDLRLILASAQALVKIDPAESAACTDLLFKLLETYEAETTESGFFPIEEALLAIHHAILESTRLALVDTGEPPLDAAEKIAIIRAIRLTDGKTITQAQREEIANLLHDADISIYTIKILFSEGIFGQER